MSRDYANRARKKPASRNSRVKPSRRPLPGWLWLAGGIFIGVLVTGLYDSIRNPGDAVSDNSDAAIETPVEEEKPRHQPRFDFYTLLQESEVVIPDEGATGPQPKTVIVPEPAKELEKVAEPKAVTEIAKTPSSAPMSTETAATQSAKIEVSKPVAAAQPAASAEKTVYVLQAGSFKNSEDADSVRANLLLLNMRVNIETVPAGNNQTWHRVLVGPFESTADLSAAKAMLTRNGIDSIQLKRRM